MINELKNIEKTILLDLLRKPEVWKSLDINYHPPHVERLYTFYGDYKISLHKIYSCKKQDALLHPHPWKAAFHILDGVYETGIGFSDTKEVPKEMSTFITYGEAYYDMTTPNIWHYVRPRRKNDWCYSVMLSSKPYTDDEMNPAVAKSSKSLKELSQEKIDSLLRSFLVLYENK